MAAPASRTPTRRRRLGSLPSGAATENGRKKPAWELYGFARWVAWRSRLLRSLARPTPPALHAGTQWVLLPAHPRPPRALRACAAPISALLPRLWRGARAESERVRERRRTRGPGPLSRRAAPPASPGRSPLPSPPLPSLPPFPPPQAAAPSPPPRGPDGSTGSSGSSSSSSSGGGASSPAARPRAQRGPRMSPGGGGGGGSDREQQAAAPRVVKN
ncbi:vasodilator-stimulated phosphoprotein-like [Harpia harpyja]|uniref:vasodilator-stimulated phosphoprotein-like n=1 Tax=Harpia harpyja TaxID=202280 RepID=UPI0022B11BAB|nr:vasodilator-stimulated phosphoprotein-like [Harpia harpyja]